MTEGLRGAGYHGARRRLDLFPVRRPRGVGHRPRRRELRRRGGRAGRGRGRPAVGLRRARPAAASRPPVLRQEGRDDRRRASPRWPGRRSCSHEPGRGSRPTPRAARHRCRRASWSASRRSTGSRSAGCDRRSRRAPRARGRRRSSNGATVPAPRRGELVRLLGEELREAKPLLAKLVTLEAGKIVQESLGEVQEMIDICDFAVGLSRQLYGLTIASERPNHRMMEQWHPLGPVLVISAFNFPVAVWAWNAALALVCGDPVIWKPSEKTPLCAEAVMALVRRALARFGDAPDGLVQLVQGEPRRRRGAGRRPAHRAGLGDRLDRDGPRGRPARRAALRPRAARARRQQCDDRLPDRRPRARRARDPVLGRRDGGPALHDAAAADRPRERRRRAGRAAASSCSRR